MDEMRKAFEAWAQGCGWDISKIGSGEGWDGTYTNTAVRFMWEAWQAACTAEREACAKMCEFIYTPSRLSDPGRSWITGTLDCAAAIRARSQQ